MKYQNDNFYIENVLKGDSSAYANLVNKHKDMVFTIVHRIVRNREDAEEIAQDVFLKVFQSLNSFKYKSKFSTWLYRIAYNTAISKTRKKYLETSLIDNEIIDNFTIDEITQNINELNKEEQKKYIQSAIKELPENENVIITLFYQNENSVEEISEITGLSKSNVKVKLHRIRIKLYSELQHLFEIKVNELV